MDLNTDLARLHKEVRVPAVLAIAASAAFAWVLTYPLFRLRLHPYYAAVLATVFPASATVLAGGDVVLAAVH